MTNPTLISTPFAQNGDKSIIQETTGSEPNSATWEAGFPVITSEPIITGGLPPKRVDFNGALNAITANIVHQSKGLGYEFDAAYAAKIGGYPLHSRLTLTNGNIVKSITPSNTTDPNLDLTGWSLEGVGIFANIDDYGASPTATRAENSLAIATALLENKIVYVPPNDYLVDIDSINMNTGNVLFGRGRLIGPSPNTLGVADGSGTMLRIDKKSNIRIIGVSLVNGYQSKAIYGSGCSDVELVDVTIDGFSFGVWFGEDDVGQGCIGVRMIRPKILNTRYWGTYFRCLGVETESQKTQNIKVIDPYYYNCNMAGFVAAEGNVKNIVLENPVFERCNVNMHFESASEYTVINPRDYDTGKKPDHVQPNTEYPFTNWSMYHVFSSDAKIIGGQMERSCYHSAGSDGKSSNISYVGTTALDWVFEGVGATVDTNKDFFSNYSWSQCTSTGIFIYQQPVDQPSAYLRNFSIDNSYCLAVGANNGNTVGVSIVRSVDVKVNQVSFDNACLRITCQGTLYVTDNTFNGTDNTQSVLDGTNGSLGEGNFLQFTGNIFKRAGGAVVGDAAVLIKNWTRARADNVVRGNFIPYAYRFTDNYRLEIGGGLIYDTTTGNYAESGTTSLVNLFATP